jgi:hypothetical protein
MCRCLGGRGGSRIIGGLLRRFGSWGLDLSDAESKWNEASYELLDLKVAGLIGIAFNYQDIAV